MAVQRRVNWISQQRVDVPDMRSLESAAANDFDGLIQSFVTGTTQGYIMRGFEISMAGAIGGAASGLQLIVDPGAVFHVASSQSGTFYLVPVGTPAQQLNSATNTIIDGAFAPSAINYIGLEYERFIDDTTSSQVYIWNPTTNNETTKNAPRAQILRYRIKITTSIFASNVLPIATVTTDSGNNVVSITDARWMLFRLGTGGASPNPFYVYPWTNQPEGRVENPSTSSSNSVNPFHGGDKMILTLKEWMNAMMTALQEIKGTVYWYSPGSAGSIDSLRTDLGNTITTGAGVIAHSPDTAGLINWDEDIFLKIVGSRLQYRFVANPTSTDITLADNQVAYVTLIRDVQITPNLVFTNSSAIVQSVGSIAWTGPLQPGDWIKLGSDTVAGYYQIQSVDSLSQVTLTVPFAGSSTGAGGAKAKYTFGSYSTSATPSSTRDIFIADRASVPTGADVFWFLLRADNAGVIPKVYVRFIGTELEMGETEDIDDGVPKQLLQYIGAPLESSSKPNYSSAINPGALPEITDLLMPAANAIVSARYFLINSAADARKYYVWYKKDGSGVDPAPSADRIGIEVDISTGQTDAQVATATAAALSSTFSPDFLAVTRPNPNQNVVRVTNTSGGVTADTVNFNMPAPFTVTIVQQGTGSGNYVVNDGDNLTKAIKKLDQAIGSLIAGANNPNYDEPLIVIGSAPSDSNHVQGPLSAGSILTLPNNSREASIPQAYTVGRGVLEVLLNGQYIPLNLAGGASDVNVASNHVVAGTETLTAPAEWAGQSFQATSAGVLNSVVFSIRASAAVVGNGFVQIYADNGSGLPGTLLATSANVDFSTLTSSFADITFTFSSGPSLALATTYHVIVNNSGITFGGNQIQLQSSNTDVYASGSVIITTNSGSSWAAITSADCYFDVTVNIGSGQGITDGWTEVGAAGTVSTTIQMHQDIVVGDIIEFRFGGGSGGGGGGGGGGVGPQGPPGPTGPPGADALGGPVSISSKNANYTLMLSDNVILGDATSAAITLTLPSAASATGSVFFLKKIDSSVNAVTVKGNGSELIDGANTLVISTQYAAVTVVSNGTQWYVI